ncbi:MAG: hypothetical protein IIA54_05830, partial [Chloroflexi bacterium]|nr:hypothetical protein [Chloroflexota bacterium]
DKSVFEYIPEGAAAFAAVSLNEPTYSIGQTPKADGDSPPIVTAMDFGRELFGNIVSLSVFVLPPDDSAVRGPGSIPDVAAVITVNDPTKSEALWTQILGFASMATGRSTMEGASEKIEGVLVRSYTMKGGVSVYLGVTDHQLIISPSKAAIARAIRAPLTPTPRMPILRTRPVAGPVGLLLGDVMGIDSLGPHEGRPVRLWAASLSASVWRRP